MVKFLLVSNLLSTREMMMSSVILICGTSYMIYELFAFTYIRELGYNGDDTVVFVDMVTLRPLCDVIDQMLLQVGGTKEEWVRNSLLFLPWVRN
jgi:hypothetical protein